MTVDELVNRVRNTPGPRVVILNTVQNAAIVALAMKKAGLDGEWVLVATSLVEAGVNFSFRTGFRERFGVASIIQLGGRVNRDGV